MKHLMSIGVIALTGVLLFSAGCQNKKGPSTASGLKSIHFDFDQASIRPDMENILDANAGYLKKHKSMKVTVEGHCDERGTNEYNLALGDRRANSVERYLTTQGVGDNRLRTVSYGEERPACTQHNETCWWENRRADFTTQ